MEIVGFVLGLLFWWTFWNRLNRIVVAVESMAAGQKNAIAQTVQMGSPSPSSPVVSDFGPAPPTMTKDVAHAEARRILQEFHANSALASTAERELGPYVEVYTVASQAPVVGFFPYFIASFTRLWGREVRSREGGGWIRIQKQLYDEGHLISVSDIRSIRRCEAPRT